MKCPLRYALTTSKDTTHPSILQEEILDTCFSYLLVKETAGLRPSLKQVIENAAAIIDERVGELYKQDTLSSVSRTIEMFYKGFPKFKENNELVLPPFELELTMHAVTVKLLVNLGIKARTKSLPITRYLFFDYSTTRSPSWNIYPRLWAAAAKMLMAEQGVNTIDTGVLNIPTGKFLPIRYSANSKVNGIIGDACIAYSAHIEYPVFGGHCHNCIVREDCANLNSF